MPSPLYRLQRGIQFHQIERCFPKKWRQSIKQPSEVRKESKPVSCSASEFIINLDVNTKKDMVECLVITLKGFASQGNLSKAIRTFSHIQGHALASSSCEFVVESLSSLLLSCTHFKLLSEGKQLHAQAITWGLQRSHVLVPKLVSQYTTFCFLDYAHHIVVDSNIRHPLPWNTLIASYVSKGRFKDVVFTYKQMTDKGVRPDHFTYPSVLKACAEQSNLDFGKDVHKSIDSSPFCGNVFVQNALVSMYGKCGDLEMAQNIFDGMPVKDEVSWNSIISGYSSIGKWNEAFKLFEQMQTGGAEINMITWNTIAGGCLKTGNFNGALELLSKMRVTGHSLDPVALIIGLGACSHIDALKLGKEIHGSAIRNSFIDYDNVKNALITMYSRCGDLTRGYIVFKSVQAKTIVTWNSMIAGYARWDRYEEASFIFRELLLTVIEPNYVTIAGLLPLCARVANLQHGKEFHCYIVKREEFQNHLLLWNALIDMYGRSGKVSVAKRLFDLLDKRDEVTYTSMIAGYGIQGEGRLAVELFEEMIRSKIKPDHVAMIAVLSACSHSGLVSQGRLIFEKMQSVYCVAPKLEHFACMVDLYGRAGLVNKAKDVILMMPYKPTAEIWATFLGACRIHGNRDIGEWAAEKLLEMKPKNPGYYVLIANMYAAGGCWAKLANVRTFMRDSGVRKDPGCAWVDIGAGFSPFLVEDTSNSQAEEIYLLLNGLSEQMKDVVYVAVEDSKVEEEFYIESLV